MISQIRFQTFLAIAFHTLLGATIMSALGSTAFAQNQFAVVNAASSRAEQPVAPGSWVSAFGRGILFAGVSQTEAAALPLPKQLGGVSVTIEGTDCPVRFVAPTQINFLIPYSTAAGLRTISIQTASATYTSSIRVLAAAPGVFTKDSSTPPRGAILNQDFSDNSSSRPAIRGQVIQIFATGHSALDRQIQDGTAAPSSPLAATKSVPQVYIGGVEAVVQFSGLAPGFAGLWQINAVVPNLSFLKGDLPVWVFMEGVDSNEVSVNVAQ